MRRVAPFVVAVFLLVCTFSLAQSNSASGELKGTVTDPSGAVVPGAGITATNADTGFSRTSTTDERGEYRILLLPPGNYSVKAELSGFAAQQRGSVQVMVGQTASADFRLQVGPSVQTIMVTDEAPAIETERAQQSNTINESYIRNLPIDRRDYLTFTLLAPGVSDSNRVVDNTDFRVKQTPQSGLSFYGSNGRGNSVTIDGAEANDAGGGVRPTIGQEAVQEFQINRSNYTAELGGASGGVINIISKSGTNNVHGKLFAFFRNQDLDAADPFALSLVGNSLTRVKPPANRQQYGGTLGVPLKKDRTFLFASYEGLNRNESSVVSVLTDFNIFQPTPQQAAVISSLATNPGTTPISCIPSNPSLAKLPPAYCAGALKAALSAKQSTVDLFKTNSGVFPFTTDTRSFSLRLDHRVSDKHQTFLRYNYTNSDDLNQNTHALVGFSRSNNVHTLDSDVVTGWTWVLSPNLVNETRFQWDYRGYYVRSNEANGPEFNITGYGYFNRDIFLPSLLLERRYEVSEGLTYLHGKHRMKFGFNFLNRTNHSETYTFQGGRFGFGDLPGGLLIPPLGAASVTAVQAFDLGVPQSYQQGFGDPLLRQSMPYYAFYAQDTWNILPNLTLNYGLRYELDVRSSPVPTDKNNFAPRFGFAWDPRNDKRTVIRGGFGIYYAQIYSQIDNIVNTLGEINGYRQIAQVLSPLSAANPLAPNGPISIFQTLRAQGVIGVPRSVRPIQASDLSQFGIAISHTGPRPPLTVLFQIDPNYRNPYSEQATLGIEHEITNGLSVSASYIFARTLKITRARDVNLLPRPVGSLGISNWADPSCSGAGIFGCFKDPTLYQNNLYESTADAFYNGMILEVSRRFGRNLSLAGNYTFSRAIDEVTDYNSDYQAFDQTNLNAERALSDFDQRHKIVFYAYLQSPFKGLSNGSLAKNILADFALTPIFRYNSPRPFNLLTGVDTNGDRHSTTDRPIFAGRNTGIGPDFWTFDLRLARVIRMGGESRALELTAEAFNLFNRLNYGSVNNTVGPAFPGPFRVHASANVGPSTPLGYTSALEARRIQLGLRLNF